MKEQETAISCTMAVNFHHPKLPTLSISTLYTFSLPGTHRDHLKRKSSPRDLTKALDVRQKPVLFWTISLSELQAHQIWNTRDVLLQIQHLLSWRIGIFYKKEKAGMKKGGEWEEREEEGWGGAKEEETSADEKGEWGNMEGGEGKSGVKKRRNEEGLPYSAAVFVWLYVDWWLSFLKDMLLNFKRERERNCGICWFILLLPHLIRILSYDILIAQYFIGNEAKAWKEHITGLRFLLAKVRPKFSAFQTSWVG